MDVSTPPWVEALRDQLPAVQRCTYLNSGTAGPIPRVAHQAIGQWAEQEFMEGRGDFSTWGAVAKLMERGRALAARVLGAGADEIALTHHTSDGINIVLGGYDWRPGEVVVTTTQEHDAVAVPLGLLRRRYGVDVRFVDIGRGEQCVEALQQALNPKVRLLIFSHIAFTTGALLPAAALVERAHANGIDVLIDGAQTAGAIPLAVHEIGAEYYTLSGQKWLCGPEGTGALYVRRSRIGQLQCAASSYFSASSHDFLGHVTLHETARRFETGMHYRPGWAGFDASAGWILDTVQVGRAWARARNLAEEASRKLSQTPGVEVVTPQDAASHLVTFTLEGFSAARASALNTLFARKRRLITRCVPHDPPALRASFGFFNTAQDIDVLVEAVVDGMAGNL